MGRVALGRDRISFDRPAGIVGEQFEGVAGAGCPRLELRFDGPFVDIGGLRFGAGSERKNGEAGSNEAKGGACGEWRPDADVAGHCGCSSFRRRFVCPAGRSYLRWIDRAD